MALGTTATILFADLCGFTRLSNSLDDASLDRLLDRFEGLALAVLTRHGGRLVKLIGDEVMIVTSSPAVAARIALDLVEAAEADDLLPGLKAGISSGPVLVRRGDCFGATVNRAHRIVDVAPCGDVLSDEPVDGIDSEPAGIVDLRDFGPTTVWSLQQARSRASLASAMEAL